MAERKVRTAKWSRIERVLNTGAVAEKGNVAAFNKTNGTLVVSSVAATLHPVGFFEDSFTGDGVRKAKVRLFSEIDVALFGNAAVGPVADDDVGTVCYLASPWEVTMTPTGASVAGRVWGVVPDGVWVQIFGGPISVALDE
jgi:hypothetical protein